MDYVTLQFVGRNQGSPHGAEAGSKRNNRGPNASRKKASRYALW
jgi:hypothetical protein